MHRTESERRGEDQEDKAAGEEAVAEQRKGHRVESNGLSGKR